MKNGLAKMNQRQIVGGRDRPSTASAGVAAPSSAARRESLSSTLTEVAKYKNLNRGVQGSLEVSAIEHDLQDYARGKEPSIDAAGYGSGGMLILAVSAVAKHIVGLQSGTHDG